MILKEIFERIISQKMCSKSVRIPRQWLDLKKQKEEKTLILSSPFTCKFLPLLILGVILLLPSLTMAFEVETHRQLTENAIESIESQLNTYLIDNLGLEGGLNEQLGIFNARGWMIEGSKFEDENGATRPINHFHDSISNDGLTLFSAVSAIDWSLSPLGAQSPGGPWSWNDAREYYFRALTSPTKAERDENWGKTFRALGQVMHLLQDQASPAHVRNDPHLALFGIGDVDGLHDFMAKRHVNNYAGSGIGPDPTILEETGATRSEPLSNLFDHNLYTGSDPTLSLGNQAGLAEYTNANFFSDDRIPGQIGAGSLFFRSYPYPSRSELFPEPTPSVYMLLLRLGAAPNSRVARLTGNQIYSNFNLAHLQFDLIDELWLDDAVYDAQSRHLIPRAVGYSAAVLTYFFRGELPLLESEPHHNTYEVCHNPNGTFESQGVLSADLILSPELKVTGTVSLYYDLDGIRVLGQTFQITPSSPAIHAGAPIPLAQLPFFEPVRWTLVLDGKMGPGELEDRAILGKTELVPWLDRLCPI